ncbi:MAG: SGNH/GDSL hydrolase family protein [Microbacterium chocolatum]|nr:SGNH/GDSL hydrolase family protein [Microbacterium chocolatum]
MARLPEVGGDKGNWGDILNDYLSQAHAGDGSLKPISQNTVEGLESELAAKVDITDLGVAGTPARAALDGAYAHMNDGVLKTAGTPVESLNVVFDGDSLTLGTSAPTGYSMPNQSMEGIPRATWHNLGINSRSSSQLLMDASTRVDPLFVDGSNNVVVVWIGTNDITSAAPGVGATYDNIVAYCNGRRSIGFKIAVVTTIPRQDETTWPGFEARRTELNTLIRANWENFADVLVDTDTDPVFSDPSAPFNPRYYREAVQTGISSGGGTHLTTEGYARIASLVRTALDALTVRVPQVKGYYNLVRTRLFIPAAAFRPSAGGTLSTGSVNLASWVFPPGSTTGAFLGSSFEWPQDWIGGNRSLTVNVIWSPASTGLTGDVAFSVRLRKLRVGFAHDEDMLTNNAFGAVGPDKIVLRSTVATALLASHLVDTISTQVTIVRNLSHTSDTYEGSINFHGIEIVR